MFTIYSIGDSAFLEQILIAIAMVTNTGDFTKMVSSGLLLGVLIMAFQSLFRGGQTIPFQQILVCWILYACGFGPSTTVVIEDAYTGDARVVSQVPVGIAGAGSIISTVGYSITSLFETGYGVISPSVTSNHFADSLKLLNDVRKGVADPAVFSAINSQIGGEADLRRSLFTYISECTLVKLDLDLISAEEMFTKHTMSALRFDSDVYGTKVYDGPVGGTNVNCSEGFDRIQDMLSTIGMPDSQEAISAVMRDNDIYTDIFTQLDNAMHALGLGMSDAQNYVQLSLIEPVYHEAAAGKYRDFRDFTSSMMVNQAIQQRNTQWSAESSMFMSIVRPMLTFIEGFVYAITPFMAFLVVLGGFGIQLAVKYGQMLLWTQLWMPVLAIINLFLHMAASREMASYSMDTAGISTFYTLSRSSDILENWIATGGMLAAATPILTLVLVTGSSYAMTSLAGRMQGGDHVNEKMSNPDAATNDAVLKNMPMQTQDPTQGQRGTGAEKAIGQFAIGAQAGEVVSSAEAHMVASSQQFQSQLQSAVQQAGTTSQGQALNHSIAGSVASSGADGSQAMTSAATRLAKDLGHTGSEATATANQVIAQAMGGGGLNLPILNAGFKSSQGTTDSDNSELRMSASDLQSYMRDNGVSDSQSAEIRNSVAEDISRMDKSEVSSSWGVSNSESLVQSASDLAQSSQTFSEVQSLSSNFGANASYDWATLGKSLSQPQTSGQQAAASQLNEASMFFNDNMKAEVNDRVGVLTETHDFTEGQAQRIAQLETMSNPYAYDSQDDYLKGMQQVMSIVGGATGQNFTGSGDATNPLANQELSGQTPSLDGSNVTQAVQQGITPPSQQGHNGETGMRDIQQGASTGITNEDATNVLNHTSETPDAISNHHARESSKVDETDRNNVRTIAGEAFTSSEGALAAAASSASDVEPGLLANALNTAVGNSPDGGGFMTTPERQFDLLVSQMPQEDRSDLIQKIDSGQTSIQDFLSEQKGFSFGGQSAGDADPATAEALLRAENGDPSGMQSLDLDRQNQAMDIRLNRPEVMYGASAESTAPEDYQKFQARFEQLSNAHPNLSEGVIGTMAAVGAGASQEALLTQYGSMVEGEQRDLLAQQGITDEGRVSANTENAQKVAISHALGNDGTDVNLQAISNMYDNGERAESGSRFVQPNDTSSYQPVDAPAPSQSAYSQKPSTANVTSNDDAPTSSNSAPAPLAAPPTPNN